MKTRIILSALAILAIASFSSPVFAQNDGGFGYNVGGFLDENGDGYNDLAPDADGDGIPNGLDSDYAPPLDGTGNRMNIDTGCGDDGFVYRNAFQYKQGEGTTGFGPGDGTGDGIGDGFGPGDGTGNDGVGPRDGTGFGPGDGTCIQALDGSGAGINGQGNHN
jgi:hypothetical protein